MRVVVTGAAGKAGKFVVEELKRAGWSVVASDIAVSTLSSATGDVGSIKADLTDLGQTIELLTGADAVVHLGNIAFPGMYPPTKTFIDNLTMNYHVFTAARINRLKRVVWLSSSSVIGDMYDPTKTVRVPVDETAPRSPSNTYSLSKALTEEMAEFFARDGLSIVGLRATFVEDPSAYANYARFQKEPSLRMWHMWSYIDTRDLASACRLAIEADLSDSHCLFVTAADTVSDRETAELYRLRFGDADAGTCPAGHQPFVSGRKAFELIGFVPRYSWRDGA